MSQDTTPQAPITDFSKLASSRKIRIKDKKLHPGAFEYWPECIKIDQLPRQKLLELQQSRLQDLVDHVTVHVPFYKQWAKDSGFKPGDPIKITDLPVVTKADYLQDIELFQSDAYNPSELTPLKTSGSSGIPFKFRRHPRNADYAYCCMWRALHRFGLRPGDRRVYLWGQSFSFNSSPLNNAKIRAKLALRNWLNNTLAIGAYDLTFQNVKHNIERIERYKPVYMHGYVSALYTIARALVEEGRTLNAPNLKAIITESEKVYDFQRETMEKAFNCPVLEHYGSVEFGNIAQPDPDGNMRINEDIFIVEKNNKDEILATGLFSQAFPFIRYNLADLIELHDEIKPGLPFASFKKIVGRTVDMIPVLAGGHVHGVALSHLINPHLDHILKFQIHQTKLDHFIVRLVPHTTIPESTIKTIHKDLASLVGDQTTIEILSVDHITPAPSGKFRWVISDVNLSAPPAPAD